MKPTHITSWLDDSEGKGHSLKRTISEDNLGWLLELDERCVRSVLDKSGMDQAKAVVRPGGKEASTAATAPEENNLTRAATETTLVRCIGAVYE